ncbi:acyltransferase family protein [Nocardiopsis lambiniae]|uniref:Acyltransferase family protein n=1 Tax=Nocardiopsis lambiniae TaxID=3075539 RepID=A0ABU2M4K3_9ACTN|nr:acyltransferase family protein [Nocardiopsis sp. DSM 44743]MDT0327508.1 acyltransferase family protein [Nocardiopsis sp. DSM 44743]
MSTPERGGFRPEIEGLRAVAVLLVAGYHIWFGRVSGGVDVFLLLTGFLITGSLVRSAERHGRIDVLGFWTRLLRRLTPAVGVVLVAILAMTYLWLPRSRWPDVISEVYAAALYHENWALARAAVDYLAREGAPSPVQHFWSLSIQGQFYVLWPLLLGAVLLAVGRSRIRHAALVAIGAVLVLSLAYSMWITAVDQPWAYFDTGARLWEFALGGVLALVVHRLTPPRPVRVILGWVGLVALVLCGVLLPVSSLFPGYAALWPTLAAVAVIVAGDSGSRFGVDRLLTRRPLMALGGLSYALYLWHWPILVVHLQLTGRSLATPLGGAAVLGLSLVLAWVTKRIVEGGAERITLRVRRAWLPAWSASLAALLLAPPLVLGSQWSDRIAEQRRERTERVIEPVDYPGAALVTRPELAGVLPDLPVVPDPLDARDDLSDHHLQGCHVNLHAEEPEVCRTGPEDAEHTLALVGASRTAHWYPAVQAVAETHGWRLVSFTKSGCQFASGVPHTQGRVFTECQEWNARAMAELELLRPDAVLTSSTRSSVEGETVPAGFVDRWRELDALGIDVIGIRDLPRRPYAGAECVASEPIEECTSPAVYAQADRDPAVVLDEAGDLPDNVTLVDLTGHVCPDGRCDAVVGNILVFWDYSHMTATYARTLIPAMEETLVTATGWAPDPENS